MRVGLTTRLSDFATNRHESCRLDGRIGADHGFRQSGRRDGKYCGIGRRVLGGEPVENVTSPWALVQNGVSMSRTSMGILSCPHTPMSWWALP